MTTSTLLIKNMVCNRCVLAVEQILAKESIPFKKVMISQVSLDNELTGDQKNRLVISLKHMGFELIVHPAGALVEHIRLLVIKKARNEVSEKENKMKLSLYIARAVHREYTYLSSLFSAVEGRTIENYFLVQRIEKVKELLSYGEQTLSQIAFDLDYSSVAHLSTQFKSITGLTPTCFRESGPGKRVPLDKV